LASRLDIRARPHRPIGRTCDVLRIIRLPDADSSQNSHAALGMKGKLNVT
jgi:hypothetical protein